MLVERIAPRFQGTVIVAAPGPSLTQEIAERCRGYPVVACKNAYLLFPWADVLYQCESRWWDAHEGCPNFKGEKWSSHGKEGLDDKRDVAAKYGLHLVQGRHGPGFSLDPKHIHYGRNSGFQAINLAVLMGGTRIVLAGFDMKAGPNGRYFDGRHPTWKDQSFGFSAFLPEFTRAARMLPPHIKVINATPRSGLRSFPMMDLTDALALAPRH